MRTCFRYGSNGDREPQFPGIVVAALLLMPLLPLLSGPPAAGTTQTRFADGSTGAVLTFPAGGGTLTASFKVPAGASVKSAALTVGGEPVQYGGQWGQTATKEFSKNNNTNMNLTGDRLSLARQPLHLRASLGANYNNLRSAGSTQNAFDVDPDTGEVAWRQSYYGWCCWCCQLYRFKTVNDFRNWNPTTSFWMPGMTDYYGTYHVQYKGQYYYSDTSWRMVKYNYTTSSTLRVSISGFNGYNFNWGGNTGLNFFHDEQGLWILYTANPYGNQILISRIDPDTLSILKTWVVSQRSMTGTGWAFTVNGTFYFGDTYNSGQFSGKYDTSTSTYTSYSNAFYSSGYLAMATYNPATRSIYTVDSSNHYEFPNAVIDNYYGSGSSLGPLIAPDHLKSWGTLNYTSDTSPAGTSAWVDVLAEDGTPLAEDLATDVKLPDAGVPAVPIRLQVSLTASDQNLTPVLDDINLTYTQEYLPKDPTIDIGGDGTNDWSWDGEYLGSTTTGNLAGALQSYLAVHSSDADSGGNVTVPVKVRALSAGTVRLTGLSVRYNQPPAVTGAAPASDPTMKEGESLKFSLQASDRDGDALSYRWYLDDARLTADTSAYTFNASFTSSGAHTLKAEVSDGEFTAAKMWYITVLNVNRRPAYSVLFPSTQVEAAAEEGGELRFIALGSDPDGDALTQWWLLDDRPAGVGSVYSYQPGFATAGDHTVTSILTDGELYANATWRVQVANVNRPPSATLLLPKEGKEYFAGETIEFSATATDPDGDVLRYAWSDAEGTLLSTAPAFSTSLAAGTHALRLTVSDGNVTVNLSVRLSVLDPAERVEVVSVDTSLPTPVVGDEVKFTVTLRNSATVEVKSWPVRLAVDGVAVGNITVESVPAGSTAQAVFRWKATKGTHSVEAVSGGGRAGRTLTVSERGVFGERVSTGSESAAWPLWMGLALALLVAGLFAGLFVGKVRERRTPPPYTPHEPEPLPTPLGPPPPQMPPAAAPPEPVPAPQHHQTQQQAAVPPPPPPQAWSAATGRGEVAGPADPATPPAAAPVAHHQPAHAPHEERPAGKMPGRDPAESEEFARDLLEWCSHAIGEAESQGRNVEEERNMLRLAHSYIRAENFSKAVHYGRKIRMQLGGGGQG